MIYKLTMDFELKTITFTSTTVQLRYHLNMPCIYRAFEYYDVYLNTSPANIVLFIYDDLCVQTGIKGMVK